MTALRSAAPPRRRFAGQGLLPAAAALLVLIVLTVSALCATNNPPSRTPVSAVPGFSASAAGVQAAALQAPPNESCAGQHSQETAVSTAAASCTGGAAVPAGAPGHVQQGLPMAAASVSAWVPAPYALPGTTQYIRTSRPCAPSLTQLSISRT